VPAARSTTTAVTTRAASAGAPHPRQEVRAAEVQLAQDDQVREVQADQERRARIGQQQAPVQQGGFPPSPAPGGVHQDRRQERDRGIQVQRRGRDADHDGRAREHRAPGAGDPGELLPGVVGHPTDQLQPGHQGKTATSPATLPRPRQPGSPRLRYQPGYTRAGKQPGEAILRSRP
jgi:hypothetical protein